MQERKDPARRWTHNRLPVPSRLPLQDKGRSDSSTSSDSSPICLEDLREMHTAEEVIDACLLDTSAGRLSRNARQVARVALAILPDGAISAKEYRNRIREEYLRQNQCGSFFLVFVLPIIISLVSQWIAAWILKHRGTPIQTIRQEAIASIKESKP